MCPKKFDMNGKPPLRFVVNFNIDYQALDYFCMKTEMLILELHYFKVSILIPPSKALHMSLGHILVCLLLLHRSNILWVCKFYHFIITNSAYVMNKLISTELLQERRVSVGADTFHF